MKINFESGRNMSPYLNVILFLELRHSTHFGCFRKTLAEIYDVCEHDKTHYIKQFHLFSLSPAHISVSNIF